MPALCGASPERYKTEQGKLTMNIKRTIFRDAVTPAESAGVTVFVMIVENQVPRNIET